MGLLMEYLFERYRRRRTDGIPKLSQFAASVATYALCVAVSLATLWPAKDIGWAATGKMFSKFGDGEHFGVAFAKWAGLAWVPQTTDPVSLWKEPHYWPDAAILPFILLIFYGIFRTHRRLGLMLAAISVMGILFSNATSVAAIRHIGIGYIAFLVALWMMRFRGEQVSSLSYVLLGFAVVGNIYNVARQWGRPFADDDVTAQWIRDNHLDNEPLMGTPDTNIIGVPERLQRPVYEIECNCVDRVLTFSHRRDDFDVRKDIPARMVRGVKTLGAPSVLFLMNRPLTAEEQGELSDGRVAAAPLAKFDRGYVSDEHFYVYRLTLTPPR